MPEVSSRTTSTSKPSPTMSGRSGQARTHVTTGCLQKDLTERRITHDHYFHSVLGLMDVKTDAYSAQLDMFAGCRHAAG